MVWFLARKTQNQTKQMLQVIVFTIYISVFCYCQSEDLEICSPPPCGLYCISICLNEGSWLLNQMLTFDSTRKCPKGWLFFSPTIAVERDDKTHISFYLTLILQRHTKQRKIKLLDFKV